MYNVSLFGTVSRNRALERLVFGVMDVELLASKDGAQLLRRLLRIYTDSGVGAFGI
jgi:hypothetical protein